jgi:hypothetical protein
VESPAWEPSRPTSSYKTWKARPRGGRCSPKGTIGSVGVRFIPSPLHLEQWYMKNSKVTERLREEIDQIPIIDTHEHILPRKEVLKTQVDLFSLLERSYLNADLVSAGMPVGAWERGAVASLASDPYSDGLLADALAIRLLQGEDPGTITPVKPTGFNMYVNLSAAQKMGVTIPQAVVDRVFKICE